MKLLRYGPKGQEKPGLLDDAGKIRDLSGVVKDIDGSVLADLSAIRAVKIDSLPVVAVGVRLAEPVANVGKFICIGLNYSDHAAESGMPEPSEPIIFMKATSAIIGPNDDVYLPPTSKKGDWEVEMGIVIGREARYVSKDKALDYVAGACVVNDLSEREYQLERLGTWDKGKGCDTFGPFGPYLVTLDEVGDLNNLGLWLDLNGKRVQTGNTRSLIFDVPTLISYITQFMSLQPGDVISTGTPPGVGLGMKPPVFLKEG
ncbi:MAG TPA: fumarylacetoacetate hydrolase family protein, partial [Rhizomicrobium sp.]|nr:fumarylacetoacetate hydrolase family protein [Rhizomicrobium sp.]